MSRRGRRVTSPSDKLYHLGNSRLCQNKRGLRIIGGNCRGITKGWRPPLEMGEGENNNLAGSRSKKESLSHYSARQAPAMR